MRYPGTYTFLSFTLRPAGAVATDVILARQWIEGDPYHRKMDPAFWVEQDFDRESYLLSDHEGPLFFWKGVVCWEADVGGIEMHIQFPPPPESQVEARHLRARIREGLWEGLAWIEAILRQAGVEQICFDSSNPELTAFCVRHLRFEADASQGGRLRKRLLPLTRGAEVAQKGS